MALSGELVYYVLVLLSSIGEKASAMRCQVLKSFVYCQDMLVEDEK